MGLPHLREELEQVISDLEEATRVPDAARQPEVARARAVVDEARSALSSAFLSRRALIVAGEAIGRARAAVGKAVEVSRVLRERSADLRSRAEDSCAMAAATGDVAGVLAAWSERLKGQLDRPTRGTVVIDSGLAPGPNREAVDETIRRVLSAAGGDWKVWLTVPAEATWWGLRVKGPGIDWTGILQDAGEQSSQGVSARLEPLVRVALAEALYRRDNPRERRSKGRGGGLGGSISEV